MNATYLAYLIFAATVTVLSFETQDVYYDDYREELKPRLVVLTDIAPADVEPDDMESAIRLMAYADMFEIEAIMTTVGWNCDPYPEEWSKYLDQVVEAYGKDVDRLKARSKQKGFMTIEEESWRQPMGYWPSVEYIRSRILPGSHRGGIGVVGEDNDSRGSDFLISLALEDDPRPIWVAAWGGGNTLAQAIWRMQQRYSDEEMETFLRKFRIYTITDQDMQYSMRMNRAYSSHQWMRREFQDYLKFIWDENTWQLQCELGKQNWAKHQQYIQNKSALGSIYPNYKWGVEGDTPSFLYVMPNGLSDPNDPHQAGWGGYHTFGLSPDEQTNAWTSWEPMQKRITESYKQRFYPDELNDFCARMQWAQDGKGNHNPEVYINGKHSSRPLVLKVKAGKTLRLSAKQTKDADKDKLTYQWWQQPEAGSVGTQLTIAGAKTAVAKIAIPANATGKIFHIVCEVHDDGPFHLVGYQRVIIRVM
ncbi:MAG: DUF1593 domain-containing protein [Bacteroidaceae bacterium]|nr:DUF1593 domain-containing protein [Bacteroidaceae bacterium]